MAALNAAKLATVLPTARQIGLAGLRAAALAQRTAAGAAPLFSARYQPQSLGLLSERLSQSLLSRFGVRVGRARWARLSQPVFVFLKRYGSRQNADAGLGDTSWAETTRPSAWRHEEILRTERVRTAWRRNLPTEIAARRAWRPDQFTAPEQAAAAPSADMFWEPALPMRIGKTSVGEAAAWAQEEAALKGTARHYRRQPVLARMTWLWRPWSPLYRPQRLWPIVREYVQAPSETLTTAVPASLFRPHLEAKPPMTIQAVRQRGSFVPSRLSVFRRLTRVLTTTTFAAQHGVYQALAGRFGRGAAASAPSRVFLRLRFAPPNISAADKPTENRQAMPYFGLRQAAVSRTALRFPGQMSVAAPSSTGRPETVTNSLTARLLSYRADRARQAHQGPKASMSPVSPGAISAAEKRPGGAFSRFAATQYGIFANAGLGLRERIAAQGHLLRARGTVGAKRGGSEWTSRYLSRRFVFSDGQGVRPWQWHRLPFAPVWTRLRGRLAFGTPQRQVTDRLPMILPTRRFSETRFGTSWTASASVMAQRPTTAVTGAWLSFFARAGGHPDLFKRTLVFRPENQPSRRSEQDWPKTNAAKTNVSVSEHLSDRFDRASPAALRTELWRRGGSGVSLSDALRQRLAGPLGFDPGHARLHRTPAAAEAARRLRADAFTIGQDIFFGGGQGETTSARGVALLAHELTHVGQQTRLVGPQMRFWTPSGGDSMEQEAQQVARKVQDDFEAAPTGSAFAGHEGASPHRTATAPRPSLAFTLPVPDHTPEGPLMPSQTVAGALRPHEAAKPSAGSSARTADARAVADRVYDLMRQEIIQARRRGLGR